YWGTRSMKLLPKLKIAQKLPLAILGSAFLVALAVGLAAYFISLGTMTSQRDAAFRASLNSSAKLVTEKLTAMEVDLRLYGERADTGTALSNLARGYAEMSLGADGKQMLQRAYIAENSDPENRKAMDTSNGKAGTYDSPHKRFHSGFRVLLEGRGYADVLLLDAE